MYLESAPPNECRLSRTDTFRFSCSRDLGCFNTCCRSKHLPLPPYDIMRLKNALGVHSDLFLSRYAVYRLDPHSGFPVISLKMREDDEKTCPFVSRQGCRVYQDRPMACRLFPLSRSSTTGREGTSLEEFFLQMKTPGCLGAEGTEVQTLAGWLEVQGLLPYIEMNDKMLGLLFHSKRNHHGSLNDRQLQKIVVACYNLDVFRRFVFEEAFLERYHVDPATQIQVKTDDSALLKLAFSYLNESLFP